MTLGIILIIVIGLAILLFKAKTNGITGKPIEFRNHIRSSNSSIQAEITRANEKMIIGDYKCGVAIADKLLLMDPKNDSAYTVRATCLEALNFNLDAIEDYEEALKIDNSNANNYGLLGLTYNKIGDMEKAKKNLKVAVDKGYSNYQMMYTVLMNVSDLAKERMIARNSIPENLQRRRINCYEDDLSEVDRNLLNETVRSNLSLLETQIRENPNNQDLKQLYEFAIKNYK